MLNEERVRLMTRMASYEAGEGKKNIKIGEYFRVDFISAQLLKSIVYSSLSFLIGLCLYVLYDFENFMENIYKIDLLDFAKSMLTYYIVFVVIFAVITYVVYAVRYHKAKKKLKAYYGNLKKLSAMYEKENDRNMN